MKIITIKDVYAGDHGIPINTILEVLGFVEQDPIVSYPVVGQVFLAEGEWKLVDEAYPV